MSAEDFLAAMTEDKLDEIAAHDCDASKIALEAIRLLKAAYYKLRGAMEHMPPFIGEDDFGAASLGAICCPYGEPGHFWKDGCPACYAAEKRAAKQEGTVCTACKGTHLFWVKCGCADPTCTRHIPFQCAKCGPASKVLP